MKFLIALLIGLLVNESAFCQSKVSLPLQNGSIGKFLMTDGTSLSWSTAGGTLTGTDGIIITSGSIAKLNGGSLASIGFGSGTNGYIGFTNSSGTSARISVASGTASITVGGSIIRIDAPVVDFNGFGMSAPVGSGQIAISDQQLFQSSDITFNTVQAYDGGWGLLTNGTAYFGPTTITGGIGISGTLSLTKTGTNAIETSGTVLRLKVSGTYYNFDPALGTFHQ